MTPLIPRWHVASSCCESPPDCAVDRLHHGRIAGSEQPALTVGVAPPEQWDVQIGHLEKEAKGLDRQKDNLVRLFRKELIEEEDVERQLNEVRNQRNALQQRLDTLTSQRDAASAMKQSAWDLNQRISALAVGIETASPAQRRELVSALFPQYAPFGVRLFPDGRVEATGVLEAASAENGSEGGASPGGEGHKVTAARRSADRFVSPSSSATFRLVVRAVRTGKGNYPR